MLKQQPRRLGSFYSITRPMEGFSQMTNHTHKYIYIYIYTVYIYIYLLLMMILVILMNAVLSSRLVSVRLCLQCRQGKFWLSDVVGLFP